MLLSISTLTNAPVMSLQTGAELARTQAALIDPRNLKIVAFILEGVKLDRRPSFLTIADIREISGIGIIVDSSDEFIGIDDVIKIKEVYDFDFTLMNIRVEDESKHNLGKVISYSVEPGSFYIKQLNVKRPLFKSLSDTELLIDRTQIVNVSDEKIIIRHDEREPVPAKHTVTTFTNPFRQQRAQPDSSDAAK